MRAASLLVTTLLLTILTAPAAQAVVDPLAYFAADAARPARVELRVDAAPATVITCDGPHHLRFESPIWPGFVSLLPSEQKKPLSVGFDDHGEHRMPTVRTRKALVGRLDLTPKVRAQLQRAQLGYFWLPTEMGEDIVMENIPALRRLLRGCSEG